MATSLLALVFGFNIKAIHSAVAGGDMLRRSLKLFIKLSMDLFTLS